MDPVTKSLVEAYQEVQEATYGKPKSEKKDTRLIVTNADKKANTKAYQNYKAGNKAYKAADHLGEGKKADKDYDGDGKIESGTAEYKGSKDKAIKKAIANESVGTAVDKTLDAVGEVGSTVVKGSAKAVGYVTGLPKGVKNAFKKGKKKAEAAESYEPTELMLKLVESGKFSKEELLKFHDVEEGYQREPDGGEAKERQKRREQKGGDRTEKVRGERTPMPPRGDKRREEFERWYAANVR